MSLDEFYSIKNSKNVPGYSEEELASVMSDPNFIYEICDCPVCNNKYLGKATICLICGYDYYSDNISTIKHKYQEKLSINPDYIWYLDEENK